MGAVPQAAVGVACSGPSLRAPERHFLSEHVCTSLSQRPWEVGTVASVTRTETPGLGDGKSLVQGRTANTGREASGPPAVPPPGFVPAHLGAERWALRESRLLTPLPW